MRTAYLGQYIDVVANAIAGKFEEAGIVWNYKQAGFLTKIFFFGEWGTRLFVDADRLEEARTIADGVVEEMRPDD